MKINSIAAAGKMKGQESTETWRVFCAVELPEQVSELLIRHMDTLRRLVPEGRASWSRPENIHLTLKFLGELQITKVKIFSDAVERTTKAFAPFTLGIGQPGTFPPHGSPRVLWIGLEDLSGNLAELHARLEAEAEKVGFEKERRAFHPHLTLARFREHRRRTEKPRAGNNQPARALVSAHHATLLPLTEFLVAELVVIRSELISEGSKYTVISRHSLG